MPRSLEGLALAAGLLLATAVRAGESAVGVETATTVSDSAAGLPAGGSVSLALRGDAAVSPSFTLSARAGLTAAALTWSSDDLGEFHAGNVAALSLAAVFTPGDTWELGLEASGSPPETSRSPLAQASARAVLSAESSSVGGSAWIGALVELNEALSGNAQLRAGVTRFGSTQQLVSPEGATFCTGGRCPRGLTALTAPHPTDFLQAAPGLDLGLRLDRTRLSLGGTWFVYSRDPTQIGDYRLATAGRWANTIGQPPLPFPPLFAIAPALSQRLGRWRLGLGYEYVVFAESQGHGHGVWARVGWDIDPHWALALRVDGRLNVDDPEATSSRSAGANLGFEWHTAP